MPAAHEVTPGKWTDLRVLFDNGEYSLVAGAYDGDKAVGERWNGRRGALGFPNQAGHPVWHVVPDFLIVPILHGLLDELARHSQTKGHEQRTEILRELESRVGA